MNKSTLLKDIDLNIYPDCPIEFLHIDGTMGIICDRAGLKYIVTPPLVKACEYLYDLNIRTTSAGSNSLNELGVWIEYESLSKENKKVVEQLTKKGLVVRGNSDNKDVRISINIDFETETVKSASDKFMALLESLGFELQDVMFGIKPIEEAIEQKIEDTAETKMHWNGKEFEMHIITTKTREEALAELMKEGCIDGDSLYISKELYEKHLDFVGASHKNESPLLPQ